MSSSDATLTTHTSLSDQKSRIQCRDMKSDCSPFFFRFRIDNTDHIIDVNRDNLPYDQVNIICPVYAPGTKEEDAEKYIIYNVRNGVS